MKETESETKFDFYKFQKNSKVQEHIMDREKILKYLYLFFTSANFVSAINLLREKNIGSLYVTAPLTGLLIKYIGCIYCEIVDIEIDLMKHGSSSKYYEKYKDALADSVRSALLKESELFFENSSNAYYGIYVAFLFPQVMKNL